MSLRDEVLATITRLEREKKEARREPSYALLREVLSCHGERGGREVMEALNGLLRDGRIMAGRTLNDRWIKIKND